MNNTDFRRILNDGDQSKFTPNPISNVTSLGARGRPHVAMIPRNVRPIPNAISVPRTNDDPSPRPHKKVRSSAAPKGSKLGQGYTDRVLSRNAGDSPQTSDNRENRLKALEEQLKLGQIELNVFETMRDELTAGDITATHLVKGLDRRLLERVRRGEDVLNPGPIKAHKDGNIASSQASHIDEDQELDRLARQTVIPHARQYTVKNGECVPPPETSMSKRSRAAILADHKASRQVSAQPVSQLQLNARFQKIGEKRTNLPIRSSAKGEEVLVFVDSSGRLKRKVKRSTALPQSTMSPQNTSLQTSSVNPPDMVAPEIKSSYSIEESDGDIFENVGSVYNPLGDEHGNDDSSSNEDENSSQHTQPIINARASPVSKNNQLTTSNDSNMKDLPKAQSLLIDTTTTKSESADLLPRLNYFGNSATSAEVSQKPSNPLQDPAIMAAVRRAAALDPEPVESSGAVDKEKRTHNGKYHFVPSSRDRDMEDLDLGFGSSRFDDDEDEGDSKSREGLSEWRPAHNGKEVSMQEGTSKRKRGKKKRGSDKDNAMDVLKIIDRRKAGTM